MPYVQLEQECRILYLLAHYEEIPFDSDEELENYARNNLKYWKYIESFQCIKKSIFYHYGIFEKKNHFKIGITKAFKNGRYVLVQGRIRALQQSGILMNPHSIFLIDSRKDEQKVHDHFKEIDRFDNHFQIHQSSEYSKFNMGTGLAESYFGSIDEASKILESFNFPKMIPSFKDSLLGDEIDEIKTRGQQQFEEIFQYGK